MTRENEEISHAETNKACLIEFDKVSFSYKGQDAAVNNLSMCIRRGQSIGLLGHNGAGKTTTIRLIIGLVRPQAGRIAINGFAPTSPHVPRGMMAYMPEMGGIYERLTGFQNLDFRARAANIDPATIRAKSEGWLKKFGLLKRGNEKVGYWSKGMRQRLSLACALISQPELILLDEPTNGLDPESLSIITQVLQDTQAQGATFVISSHDLNSVHKICDHIFILQMGKLIHSGMLEDTSSEDLQEKYLALTAER